MDREKVFLVEQALNGCAVSWVRGDWSDLTAICPRWGQGTALRARRRHQIWRVVEFGKEGIWKFAKTGLFARSQLRKKDADVGRPAQQMIERPV